MDGKTEKVKTHFAWPLKVLKSGNFEHLKVPKS
jgi:hypothetical protein